MTWQWFAPLNAGSPLSVTRNPPPNLGRSSAFSRVNNSSGDGGGGPCGSARAVLVAVTTEYKLQTLMFSRHCIANMIIVISGKAAKNAFIILA